MCAETIKKAAHLCKHCGHRFPEVVAKPQPLAQPNTPNGADEPKKRGSGWISFGLILIGLLVAAKVFDNSGSPAELPVASNSSEPPYQDRGVQMVWIAKSQDGIKRRLKDPDSADFRNIYFYSGGPSPTVCGEVNAKNGFGGYLGFQRFVASGESAAFLASDTSQEEFKKVWEQLCVKHERDKAHVP